MIRFIHTSDWHLGQNFMNRSRRREHEAFLSWLLAKIRELDVDALIVAGDIFDTGTPPSYARKLYYDFLKGVRSAGIQVVIVGGNHDSVSTLNESGSLLEVLDVKVIGGVTENPEDEVHIISKDEDPVGIICAVPFLRDRDVRLASEGEDADSKGEELRKGIKKHYSDVFKKAQEMNSFTEAKLPVIATGHLTTTGGEITEGVREIYIGSLQSYSEEDFPEFDYVALGHLHKKQSFGSRNHIRYCGSPIPLSFMEAQYDKYVLLVEVEAGEKPSVHELTVPRAQELKSLKGTIEQIEKELLKIKGDLENPFWVEIEITGTESVHGLQNRLSELTRDLPVEILRIKRQRNSSASSIPRKGEETLDSLSVEEVFERRLQLEEIDEPLLNKVRDAFSIIREEVRVETGR